MEHDSEYDINIIQMMCYVMLCFHLLWDLALYEIVCMGQTLGAMTLTCYEGYRRYDLMKVDMCGTFQQFPIQSPTSETFQTFPSQILLHQFCSSLDNDTGYLM